MQKFKNKKILIDIKKEIKKNILPKYKYIKDYKIIKIYKNNSYLAYYKHNSIFDNNGIPVIKLNIPCIFNSVKKENLSKYTVLLTTILHELGHAIQNYNGNMGYYDENEAENFAYMYWDLGIIIDIPQKYKYNDYIKTNII